MPISLKNKQFSRIGLLGLTLLLFAVTTFFLFHKETQTHYLPVLGKISDFQLTNADRKPFESTQLKNKVWVADFFFTTCGSICPKMTKNMASLYRSYKLENAVNFVSISVNPENDTPEQLSRYAEKYGADLDRWFFLTGDRNNIQRISLNQFKIGSLEEPVFHSPFFVLVDRYMQIRGYYDGTEEKDVRLLFKDIAQLLNDRPS